MGRNTQIEWAEATWNPIMGCTPVSEACEHCYARAMIRRFGGRKGWPDAPGDVTLYPERLEQPLHWRDPKRVFVCSMSDLFHKDVPVDFIDKVFETMVNAGRHTFMILTKRPRKMNAYMHSMGERLRYLGVNAPDVLPNVWLGVTAENQQRADERIPVLLKVPATVRFVSIEPMLGPVDLRRYIGATLKCSKHGFLHPDEWMTTKECVHCKPYGLTKRGRGLDWVIAGGETGPGARLMRAEWVRDLVEQCKDAEIPFFFKKWGDHHRKGDDARLARLTGYDSLDPHGGGRFNWADREFPTGGK